MTGCLAAFLDGSADGDAVIAELRGDRDAALDALVRAASELPAADAARLAPLWLHFGFVERETAALNHRNWSRRMRAAANLGAAADPAVVPSLVHALEDEMLDVRLAAARSLAQLRAKDAVEPILKSLALPGELPGKLAADILVQYGEVAVEPLLAFVRARLVNPEGPAFAVAVMVLGMSRAASSVPMLIETLACPEAELRIAAARALGLIGRAESVAALSARTLDPVWQVRSAAAQALGSIGDARSIPALAARLVDVAWWVRRNAAEALFRMGEPGREQLLEVLASHEDRFARDICLQVLEEHAASRKPEAVAA